MLFFGSAFLMAMTQFVEPAFPATSRGQVIVSEIEKVIIRVPQASLTVKSAPGNLLTWNMLEGTDDILVLRNDKILEIRPRDFESKSDLLKTNARRQIELVGASQNLEIHMLEGSISLSNWNHPALIDLQKGKMFLKDNTGSLRLHAGRGEILVQGHQGSLSVDSNQAAVTIKDLKGDLETSVFSAETVVDKPMGTLVMNQGQGITKILGGIGSLVYEAPKGALSAQAFQGRVDASTGEGSIAVVQGKEGDIHLRAQSGRIQVQSNPQLGSWLNAATQEGELYAPAYLKINREGSQKSIRARIKGEQQKNSIVIRSQEGSIFIR